MTRLAAWCLPILLASPAWAAERVVSLEEPGAFRTLQAAIDASAPGDRIELRPGTYAGGGLVSGKRDLVIRGSAEVRLQACVSVFRSSGIALEDVRLSSAGECDGALQVEESQDVRVQGGRVQGSQSRPGAIIRDSRRVLLQECEVTGLQKGEASAQASGRAEPLLAVQGSHEVSLSRIVAVGSALQTGVQVSKSEGVTIRESTFVRQLVPVRLLSTRGAVVAHNLLTFGGLQKEGSEVQEEGNFSDDPHFVDYLGGDYRLRPDSPLAAREGRPPGALPVASGTFPRFPAMPPRERGCPGRAPVETFWGRFTPIGWSPDGKLAFVAYDGGQAATVYPSSAVGIYDTRARKLLFREYLRGPDPLAEWTRQRGFAEVLGSHRIDWEHPPVCEGLPLAGELPVSAEIRFESDSKAALFIRAQGRRSVRALCVSGVQPLLERPREPLRPEGLVRGPDGKSVSFVTAALGESALLLTVSVEQLEPSRLEADSPAGPSKEPR